MGTILCVTVFYELLCNTTQNVTKYEQIFPHPYIFARLQPEAQKLLGRRKNLR